MIANNNIFQFQFVYYTDKYMIQTKNIISVILVPIPCSLLVSLYYIHNNMNNEV